MKKAKKVKAPKKAVKGAKVLSMPGKKAAVKVPAKKSGKGMKPLGTMKKAPRGKALSAPADKKKAPIFGIDTSKEMKGQKSAEGKNKRRKKLDGVTF